MITPVKLETSATILAASGIRHDHRAANGRMLLARGLPAGGDHCNQYLSYEGLSDGLESDARRLIGVTP
jgi:hypothetical protein